jgi:uncharacterized protein YegJ (DUF2314 family)
METDHEITVKREDISDAIFDALTLYCVENGVYEIVSKLTKEEMKPVQDAVETLLTKHGLKTV